VVAHALGGLGQAQAEVAVLPDHGGGEGNLAVARALKASPAKPLTKPGAVPAAPAPAAPKPKASASPALKSKRAKPMSDL
jgi:hypothetical protein